MLTSPRTPCVRRNAQTIFTFNTVASLPRCQINAAKPMRRLFSVPPCLEISTRMRTITRCIEWGLEYEEGADLEAEILEFMKSSSKPEAFPSRIELVEAGRADLAEAIVAKGGWLSFGWDDEEEDEEKEYIGIGDNGYEKLLDDISSTLDNDSDNGNEEDYSSSLGVAKLHDKDGTSILSLYPYDKNSGELTTITDQSTGIEGILSRLEKYRNVTLGFGVVEEDGGFSRTNKLSSSINNFNHSKPFSNDVEPKTRRSRSGQVDTQQRKQQLETETGQSKFTTNESPEVSLGEILEKKSNYEPRDETNIESRHEEITQNHLRNRLQNLELELSSVLRSVRSNGDQITPHSDHEYLSDDGQKIYDTWEFQENEIMKAQDKLRSTRAKLAVLEGKMALAIIEAQKIMEEKQKKIDDARRALRLVYSTCIVWPSPATEVLLAGSFDGWATLRKMEKSSSGLFSLWLQLYPGKYEIKFIVDGEWKVDPQRLTIDNNGYLNNLLIISSGN